MKTICEAKFAELFTVLYTTLVCYIEAEPPAYSVPTNKGQERFGIVPNRDAIRLSPGKIAADTFMAFLERADCQKVSFWCISPEKKKERESSSSLMAVWITYC